MPHFYAIAIHRLKDYTDAGIPVLPAKIGIQKTKIHIIFYIIGFIIAALALSYFKFTGYSYTIVIVILGLVWLYKALGGFRTINDNIWAKKVFLFSLIVLATTSLSIALTAWLP